MRRVPPRLLAAALLPGALLAGALIAPVVSAQSERMATDPGEAREQAREAERRAERLEAQARRADEAVAATAREAAALAARVQEAEAAIAAAEARLARIDDQRADLAERLAERREPLLRLTGALQKVARRPPILSALAPDTLRETVYLRAVLETTMPEIRRRTAALREEIRLGRALEREARRMVAGLRANERALEARRARLAAVETRQRLESRRRGGAAAREADRALALAEEARDLDALARRLDETARLRAELAALPAPLLRPANGTRAPAPSRGASERASSEPANAAAPRFRLPVVGRIRTGFGAREADGGSATGLTFSPAAGAQIVAPGAGRVAFAGPYRGYGRIVILEHRGGWTSLVTGLARSEVAVGDTLVPGAPLGIAEPEDPVVTFELRRGGEPVNPLEFTR